VACHFSSRGTPEREDLIAWLSDYCQRKHLRFTCGALRGEEYATAFGRAKVVVDMLRNPTTRNHRTFDVMASRACLLTNPLPDVEGEDHGRPGEHYATWRDYADLEDKLDWLLRSYDWSQIAYAGCRLVRAQHTWAIRARQLRALLGEVFDWLAT